VLYTVGGDLEITGMGDENVEVKRYFTQVESWRAYCVSNRIWSSFT